MNHFCFCNDYLLFCCFYCLSIGDIRSGRTLRKAAPPPPKERSARETSLDLIKNGGIQLKRAEPIATKKATEQVFYNSTFNSSL